METPDSAESANIYWQAQVVFLYGGKNRSVHGLDERSALLPQHSLLSLSEYLGMQRTIGNETHFRILDLLVEDGAQGAKEVKTALDIESNTLHSHFDMLVDVGLVENRK